MAYRVTVQPSNQQFQVSDQETVLEAAIKQNIPLPFGCRNGLCGACKCKILSGQIEQDTYSPGVLKEEEINANIVLLCRAHAHSDLNIQPKAIDSKTTAPVTLTCPIRSIDIFDRVAVIQLALPASSPFVFNAGQYIDILLPDHSERSFSIANAPHQQGYIELHIRNRREGKFSSYVFDRPLRVGDSLTFKGPMGNFCAQENSTKPILFVCSGTGFAPVQSIIEHIKKTKRPILLYRGARNKADLYLNQRVVVWQTELFDFNYIPILSEATASDHWTGRTGYVHQAILNDFSDLSAYQAYVCGGQKMVEATYDALIKRGLPDNEFYSDTFFTAPQIQQISTH